jgi:hypothetical protein
MPHPLRTVVDAPPGRLSSLEVPMALSRHALGKCG